MPTKPYEPFLYVSLVRDPEMAREYLRDLPEGMDLTYEDKVRLFLLGLKHITDAYRFFGLRPYFRFGVSTRPF